LRFRAVVHVAGPPGVGKTPFIEALLQSEVAFANCVRGEHARNLPDNRESASKRQPEVRRYLETGATTTAHYRLGEPDGDSFFVSDVMQDYSEVMIAYAYDLSLFTERDLLHGRFGDERQASTTATCQ